MIRSQVRSALGKVLNPSSGAGTIGQIMVNVSSGLSLTQPQESKLKTTFQKIVFFILVQETDITAVGDLPC
jgi:hypothetical protein